MNRALLRVPSIAAALEAIPPRIRERVDCDWLTGSDPVFIGLHHYQTTDDGRSYKDTAHAVYWCNQRHMARSDRKATIVLPQEMPPSTVVHELGHVLHERIGFAHVAAPVSNYAQTNQYEAFAEAFTAWIGPPDDSRHQVWWTYARSADLLDEATVALFEELAA